jgi:hypothetical protein
MPEHLKQGSRSTPTHDKDALSIYRWENPNPHRDKQIHALEFLIFDKGEDLLAFMESLTASA